MFRARQRERCPLNWDDGSFLRSHRLCREDTSQVRLSHTLARTSAVFDDPNLVSHGGLVPVVALAERAGLPELLAERVRSADRCHASARAATVSRDLVAVARRTARHSRDRLTLHLPEGWHREREWLNLFESACGPPQRPDQPRPGPHPTPHGTPRPTPTRRTRPAAQEVSGGTPTPQPPANPIVEEDPVQNSVGGLRLRTGQDTSGLARFQVNAEPHRPAVRGRLPAGRIASPGSARRKTQPA
jgi:hypothetical protein